MENSNRRTRIACCLPGEDFSSTWVANWTGMVAHLVGRYEVFPVFGHTSNVYMSRQLLLETALAVSPKPDYILWIDDDNPTRPDQFELLLSGMLDNPGAILVAGWAWVQSEVHGKQAVVSGGYFDRKGRPQPVEHREFMATPNSLYDAGWSGFPVALMRISLLDRLPHVPFAPVIGPEFRKGFSSEDTGFCVRSKNAGLRVLIDNRVKVPHLKRFPAEPAELSVDTEEPEQPKSVSVTSGAARKRDIPDV